jgi:epsin
MKGFSQTFEKIKQGDYGGALKQVQRQVKQVALDMTDLEVVVEEATNGEPWGPHGKLLARIAKESAVSEENFRQVMGVLIDRIQGAWKKPKQWRQAYKSLLVLDYIIKNGPEAVVGELSHDESMDLFSDLEKFKYVDPETLRDHGVNVRKRATDIAALLMDPERLQEEREIAAKSKSKLVGYSKGDSSPSSSRSNWATREGNYASGGGSPSSNLYETENKAAWGKQRTFTSGPTLVRTKPSFSVPVDQQQQPKQSADDAKRDESLQESREGDLLGLGGEKGKDSGGNTASSPIPNPVKIPEEGAHRTTNKQVGASKESRTQRKNKFLSQTKINPKIKNTLQIKGFSSNAPEGNKVEQDLMSLTGDELQESSLPQESSKLKVEQDLMSLVEDSSQQTNANTASGSWDAFGTTTTTAAAAGNNSNSGQQEWANFDQASAGQIPTLSQQPNTNTDWMNNSLAPVSTAVQPQMQSTRSNPPPLVNTLDPLLFSAPVPGQSPSLPLSSGNMNSRSTWPNQTPLQQPFPNVNMGSKGNPPKLGQKGVSTSDDPFKDLLG